MTILKFLTGLSWVSGVIAVFAILYYAADWDRKSGTQEERGREIGFWLFVAILALAWLIGWYLI